jgi:hypothetical protein
MSKYANAACAMLDWLHRNEIKAGSVAQPSKSDPVIVVYGMTKAGIKKLPKTFDGFKVEGTTEVPDYTRGQLNQRIPIEPQ